MVARAADCERAVVSSDRLHAATSEDFLREILPADETKVQLRAGFTRSRLVELDRVRGGDHQFEERFPRQVEP